MAASQAVDKAKRTLSWSLSLHGGAYGGTPDGELLMAVEAAERTLRLCETKRHEAYQKQMQAITARKASQTRMSG